MLPFRAERRAPGVRKTELIMPTHTNGNIVEQKTRELCQAILDQPNMSLNRQRIDAFIADEKSRAEYDSLMKKGQVLQEKQQRAETLDAQEIADFERHREEVLNNSVIRGFLDSQKELHDLHHTIQEHVTKTLELGRVPTPEDFESCGCGDGCGCHEH